MRKGRYPGGKKGLIYSSRVINGGASDERVGELWKEKVGGETGGKGRKMKGIESKKNEVQSGSVAGTGVSGDEMTWDGRRESRRTYRQ